MLMQSEAFPEGFTSGLEEAWVQRYSCSHHIPPQYRKAVLQQRSGPGLYNTAGSLSIGVWVTTAGLVYVSRRSLNTVLISSTLSYSFFPFEIV